MKRYYEKHGYHYILNFNQGLVTFFSRIEFKAEDEEGKTHVLYGEQSGIVMNDVVDGITMHDSINKEIEKHEYLDFMISLEGIEGIMEDELKNTISLSVHGDYAEPF